MGLFSQYKLHKIKLLMISNYKIYLFIISIFFVKYSYSNFDVKDTLNYDLKKVENIVVNKSNVELLSKQARNLIEYNNNDNALILINKLEKSEIVESDLNLKANVMYLKSLIYKNIGFLDSSLNLNYKVLKLSEINHNIVLKSKALNTIANIETNKGNYEKALNYYFASLDISQNSNDTASISKIYNNIGLLYNSLKEYNKAFKFLEISLSLGVKINNKKIVASSLNNIGLVYKDLGEINKSLQYFILSLNIKKNLPDKRSIAFNLITIGNVYEFKNEYSKAANYYSEAILINKNVNNVSGLVFSYMSLGMIQIKQKNYIPAKINILNSIIYAKQIEDKNNLQIAYENLSEIYYENNQFDSAYFYIQLSGVLKDSINNNEDKIQIIINNYDKQHKDEQIKLLLKDKELQDLGIESNKFTLIFLVIFTAILIFTTFFVIFIYKQKNKINKALHENSANLELKAKNEIDKNRKNELMLTLQNRQIILGQLIGNVSDRWHDSLNLIEKKIIEIKTNTINKNLNEEYINENVSDLYKTVKQMSIYIDDFRNFFRVENKKNPFELSEVVSNIQNSFEKYFIDKNINVQIVNYSKSLTVYSYKNEITQIVLSIINIFCLNEKKENLIIEFSFASTVKYGKIILTIYGNEILKFKKYFELSNVKEIDDTNINYYIIQSIVKKRINGTLLVSNSESSIEIIMEVPYE